MKFNNPVRYILLLILVFNFPKIKAQKDMEFEITKGSYNLINKKTGEKQFTGNYDFLDSFGSSANFIAKKGTKYGLINQEEIIVLPFEYDTIVDRRMRSDKIGFNISYGFIKKNGKFGLLDSLGNSSTPIHFDQAPKTSNHWGIPFSIDGKFGATSLYGEVLIPFEYDNHISINDPNFAHVKKDGKQGLYEFKKSLVLPTEYDYIYFDEDSEIFIVGKEKNRGVYHKNGEIILPIIYDKISHTSLMNGQRCLRLTKDKKKGIANFKGDFILPVEFESINCRHPKGIIVKKNNLYGLMGIDGKIILPLIYKFYKHKSNHRYNANLDVWRTEKRGYIMLENGMHYDTTAFDDFHDLAPHHIILKKGEKFRLADWYGDIKPGEYERIDCHDEIKKCFVKNNDFYGMIDYQGNTILPLKYGGFKNLGFDEKYLMFADKDFKVGVMNTEGLVILSAEYQKIEYSEKSLKDPIYLRHLAFNAMVEEKWGLVSNKGEWLIPPEYDQLGYFNEGIAPAKKDGLWGVINKNNEVVTPFQFERIRISTYGLKEVFIDEKWIKVDTKGNPIKK